MKLEVVHYRNYGCTTSTEDPIESEQRFYFCYLELNNSKIICLQLIENFEHSKCINYDFEVYQDQNYKFRYEWGEWWGKTFKILGGTEALEPSEIKCVKHFYLTEIYPYRDKTTEIVSV